MKKAILWLCLILYFSGCAKPVKIHLPENHPAYGFYQTANAFHVSGQECGKLKGSLEIRPDKIGRNLINKLMVLTISEQSEMKTNRRVLINRIEN